MAEIINETPLAEIIHETPLAEIEDLFFLTKLAKNRKILLNFANLKKPNELADYYENERDTPDNDITYLRIMSTYNQEIAKKKGIFIERTDFLDNAVLPLFGGKKIEKLKNINKNKKLLIKYSGYKSINQLKKILNEYEIPDYEKFNEIIYLRIFDK